MAQNIPVRTKWTPPPARVEGDRLLKARAAEQRVRNAAVQAEAQKERTKEILGQELGTKVDELEETVDRLIDNLPRIIPNGGGGGRKTVKYVLERDYPGVASTALNPTVETREHMVRYDFSDCKAIVINRWSSNSTFHPALYRKVGSNPGNFTAIQDRKGNWFELDPSEVPHVDALGATDSTNTPAQTTAAIQLAIDLAADRENGKALLSAREYIVDSPLYMRQGVEFCGINRQSILKADPAWPAGGLGKLFIYCVDIANYSIHDIVFDFRGSVRNAGFAAVWNLRCSYYSIYNNKVYTPLIGFASLQGCHHYSVYRNDIETVDLPGAYGGALIDNWSDNHDFRIENNDLDAKGLQLVGILLTGVDSETAPTLHPLRNIWVRGNHVKGTVGNGISLDGSRTALVDQESGWSNVIVSENIVEDTAGYYGISAYAGYCAIITNNILRNIYGSGIMSLGQGQGPEATIISDNVLENVGTSGSTDPALGSGVYISSGSEFCRVSGNIIRGNTHRTGIYLAAGANNNDVLDNVIEQLGSLGTNILDAGTGNRVSRNRGHKTECRVVSGTFDVASTGQRTISIPHGLAVIPTTTECMVCLVRDTAVLDYEIAQLVVAGADATNVTVQCRVSTASATVGATAKIALHVVAKQG